MKKITLIAQTISKLLGPKNAVTWMLKRSCVRTPFGGEGVKKSETLLKSARQQVYANFQLISKKLNCVCCFFVRWKILGPFSNIGTADHKYSCHNWEKFPQQVQPQVSSKGKTSSGNFIAFLKFTSNFERF